MPTHSMKTIHFGDNPRRFCLVLVSDADTGRAARRYASEDELFTADNIKLLHNQDYELYLAEDIRDLRTTQAVDGWYTVMFFNAGEAVGTAMALPQSAPSDVEFAQLQSRLDTEFQGYDVYTANYVASQTLRTLNPAKYDETVENYNMRLTKECFLKAYSRLDKSCVEFERNIKQDIYILRDLLDRVTNCRVDGIYNLLYGYSGSPTFTSVIGNLGVISYYLQLFGNIQQFPELIPEPSRGDLDTQAKDYMIFVALTSIRPLLVQQIKTLTQQLDTLKNLKTQ